LDQKELYVYAPSPKLFSMLTQSGIRLVQQVDSNSNIEAKGFYLFSDNCSEKEDFYHAMLHAQENQKNPTDTDSPSVPLKFDTPDLVKLVQQLHASEENLHTRWINALIGRVFLALYKTSQVKDFIASKINKKIARVPKPAIISSVQLRKVDMGTLPPFITNPKLKELTVDGDLVVEADVSYKGNFRIEISATVRIDLGTRFKAREVTLVLATVLKRLDGHILIRVKPPPSNRLWMTFETPPKMEFSLEPIVSSRQITYGVVLRAIEGRIREVVNETLVLPNWDDMPFTDTIAQIIRGGIWEDSAKDEEEDADKIKQDEATLENAISDAEKLDEKADAASAHFSIASSVDSEEVGTGVSTSTDHKSSSASTRPRALRSSSSAAQVKTDSSNASAEMSNDRITTPTSVKSLPVASPMRPDNARQTTESSESSSEDTSAASIYSASTASAPVPIMDHSRTKSRELSAQEIAAAAAAAAGASNMATKKQTINQSLNSATAAARNWLAAKQNTKPNSNTNNRPPTSEGPSIDHDSSSSSSLDPRPQLQSNPSMSKSHTEPMGRGQPLPPPGTPLPHPKNEKRPTWAIPAAASSTFANLTKRKPVAPGPSSPAVSSQRSVEDLVDSPKTTLGTASLLPAAHFPDQDARAGGGGDGDDGEDVFREMRRRKSSAASAGTANSASELATPPPPLPKRRQRQPSLNLSAHTRRASQNQNLQQSGGEGEVLLVVEAPIVEGSGGRDDEGSRERGFT
jgi:hypothetical protein